MKKVILTLCIALLGFHALQAQKDPAEIEHRAFQFTFLFPPLSTNGAANVRIVNDVSLNLFLGVSGGVNAFEAGGFINIDTWDMNGLQLAGFGNTVGADVDGAQLAGFFNVNGASVRGFQGAGFVNIAGGSFTGAQTAGFLNVAGDSLLGLQGAGFLNIAGRSESGVQAAGFGNISGSGKSHLQTAGFFNVADTVQGLQAAGFINVAEEVQGVQLAGFLNICDSIDGVPIGFVSVVRKNGYSRFALSVSEVQYLNFSYKLGVRRLYNIYSVGKQFGTTNSFMLGGGLGTGLDLNEKLKLNVEGTVFQEFRFGSANEPWFLYVDRLNLYHSLKFLFGWNVGGRVELQMGPSLNLSVAHISPDLGERPWHPIAPYSFYDRTRMNSRETNVQMWIGVQGSISF